MPLLQLRSALEEISSSSCAGDAQKGVNGLGKGASKGKTSARRGVHGRMGHRIAMLSPHAGQGAGKARLHEAFELPALAETSRARVGLNTHLGS